MRPSIFRRRPSLLNTIRRRLLSQDSQSSSNLAQKSRATSKATSEQAQKQQNRLDRLLKRAPKFLHRHVTSLRNAPVTHITAFLILHEITAVVPLFGLAGAFHYYKWLPSYFSEGAWVMAGVEKFGRYFKRKGWISGDDEQEAERLVNRGELGEVERKKKFDTGKWWSRGEGSVRIVVEFATAYAIVKALLIPRLMISAWGAPWFARWTVVPLVNVLKKIFTRGKTTSRSIGPSS